MMCISIYVVVMQSQLCSLCGSVTGNYELGSMRKDAVGD